MKAITVKQPWAGCFFLERGAKDVENRDWRPREDLVGQDLAIHAGQKLDIDAYQHVRALCGGRVPAVADRRSVVLGVVRVQAIVASYESKWRQDWTSWAWVVGEPRLLANAVVCAGSLGLWTLPKNVEGEVRRQL